MTDDGGNGKNWERIARRKMSVMLQMQYDDEVDTATRDILNATERGEDSTDAFWRMITRFDEFSDAVHQDLATLGDIHYENPKSRLFSSSSYVQEVFLNLGNAIKNESVGGGLHGDDFERARMALKHAESTLDELEDEYRGNVQDDQNDGCFPTEDDHREQLAGIARREEKKRVYSDD